MKLLFNILPPAVTMVMMLIFATLLGLTRSEVKEVKKANEALTAERDEAVQQLETRTAERDEARHDAESMLRFCKDQGFDVHKLIMPDGSFQAIRKNPDGTPNEEDVIKAIQSDMQRRQKEEAASK